MDVVPDGRWKTKQWLLLATLSGLALVVAATIHLAVALSAEGIDSAGLAVSVWSVTAGVLALMWLLAVPLVVLWHRNLSYAVDAEKIVVHKGILTKVEQHVPYRMVTDFRLQRTLYDRALDIGSILVQTAGQSQSATGYEAKLVGLTEWDRWHHELGSRIETLEPAPVSSEHGGPEPSELRLILEEVQEIRRLVEKAQS